MYYVELGKPYTLLKKRYQPAKERNGVEGRRAG
jgi:hypothetical protein